MESKCIKKVNKKNRKEMTHYLLDRNYSWEYHDELSELDPMLVTDYYFSHHDEFQENKLPGSNPIHTVKRNEANHFSHFDHANIPTIIRNEMFRKFIYPTSNPIKKKSQMMANPISYKQENVPLFITNVPLQQPILPATNVIPSASPNKKNTSRDKIDIYNENFVKINEKSVQCNICNKIIRKTEFNMKRHYELHSENKLFDCILCKKKFNRKYNLQRHLKKTHYNYNESWVCCIVCENICQDFLELNRHFEVHALSHIEIHNRPHKCHLCESRFSKKYYVKRHIKSRHMDIRPFPCQECGKKFKTKGGLTSHMYQHDDNSPHMCPFCGRRFSPKSNLIIHQRDHTGERPYQCDICKQKFKSQGKLNKHLFVHSEKRPHKCSTCGKTYKTKSNLKTHELIHKEVQETLACDICDRKFPSYKHYELKRHRDIHINGKPFKCDICEKTFISPSNLKYHQAKHSDEKPFKCETCSKDFRTGQDLNRHERNHLDEKTWTCEKCNVKFKRKDHLKKHLLTHTDLKDFECEVCKKRFNRKHNLKIHSKVHSAEYLDKIANRSKNKNKTSSNTDKNEVNTDGCNEKRNTRGRRCNYNEDFDDDDFIEISNDEEEDYE